MGSQWDIGGFVLLKFFVLLEKIILRQLNSKEIGNLGEKIAKKFLENKGYKILEQNFERKWGEIDIVAKKNKALVFVEVKCIVKKQGFFPEDEISPKKKRQLRKMSQIYLSEKKLGLSALHQIDIIAIELNPDMKKAEIRHYPNAVEDKY